MIPRLIVVAMLTAMALALWLGSQVTVTEVPVREHETATTSTPADTAVREERRGQPAQVLRVIDGDTIELVGGERVRYIGIDTPESVHPSRPVECFAKEAAAQNRALVEGKNVVLVRDITDRDKYGRLLRYVYVDGVFVNEKLVRDGYATVVTYPPDVAHTEAFLAAQRQAREANRGLWDACIGEDTDAQSSFAPAACPVKGNISVGSGERIYHVPGCEYYSRTVITESKGERWFCSEAEALAAGWRKALNCN